MPTSATSTGIFPSDVVLRNVLQRGLDDLRRHPEDLDEVFHALEDDDETAGLYGPSEAARAKEWFRNTDVPIRMANTREPPVPTFITLEVSDSQEDASTLGDKNVVPSRPDNLEWRALATFVPDAWNPATRTVTMPPSVTLVVVPGMVLVDAAGQALAVTSVPEAGQVVIADSVYPLDLSRAEIRGAQPTRAVELESIFEQETYRVGAWAYGEPTHLGWLFPILKYVLYREREELERRGMINVRYSFTGMTDDTFGQVEQLPVRYAVISAQVRQAWTKRRLERLYQVNLTVNALDEDSTPAVEIVGP